MDYLGPRPRPGNVHTEILFDDSGIVEIYHTDRRASKTKVGRGEILVKSLRASVHMYM